MGPLTKKTRRFYAIGTLRGIFRGQEAMKNFLGIVKTPSKRDETIKEAARKLNNKIDLQMGDISMKELPKKAKEIQDKIRDISVNTDLDMREFLGIDKALQIIKN